MRQDVESKGHSMSQVDLPRKVTSQFGATGSRTETIAGSLRRLTISCRSSNPLWPWRDAPLWWGSITLRRNVAPDPRLANGFASIFSSSSRCDYSQLQRRLPRHNTPIYNVFSRSTTRRPRRRRILSRRFKLCAPWRCVELQLGSFRLAQANSRTGRGGGFAASYGPPATVLGMHNFEPFCIELR